MNQNTGENYVYERIENEENYPPCGSGGWCGLRSADEKVNYYFADCKPSYPPATNIITMNTPAPEKKREIPAAIEHSIIFYQTENENIGVNVRYSNETFWLTRKAMADLFDCSTDNISLHLKHIYEEGELSEEATAEESSVVQTEGTRRICSSKTTGGASSKVQGMLPVPRPSGTQKMSTGSSGKDRIWNTSRTLTGRWRDTLKGMEKETETNGNPRTYA